jgi:hypothetical protein
VELGTPNGYGNDGWLLLLKGLQAKDIYKVLEHVIRTAFASSYIPREQRDLRGASLIEPPQQDMQVLGNSISPDELVPQSFMVRLNPES